MKKLRLKTSLLVSAAAATGLVMGAGIAFAAHPTPIKLYTFEEIGMQMNGGSPVPVQVDSAGKGMPYSPKMTCGSNGSNGSCHDYDNISDHAFHSAQGRNEYSDTNGGLFNKTKNKAWTQSTAMVGKW